MFLEQVGLFPKFQPFRARNRIVDTLYPIFTWAFNHTWALDKTRVRSRVIVLKTSPSSDGVRSCILHSLLMKKGFLIDTDRLTLCVFGGDHKNKWVGKNIHTESPRSPSSSKTLHHHHRLYEVQVRSTGGEARMKFCFPSWTIAFSGVIFSFQLSVLQCFAFEYL